MANIVVDSSVVIKWFVTEPFSAESRSILDAYQEGELALLAPALIYAEFGNILWKKHRFQGLELDDAIRILDIFGSLPIETTSSAHLLDEAFRLAAAQKRTVYDSLYLALSLRKDCPFVTADERLVNAVKATLPNVVWVAEWT